MWKQPELFNIKTRQEFQQQTETNSVISINIHVH
jgi:hypothetical protein